MQKALDAALTKVADLQDVIAKGDKAIADKDAALKDAYTVIGSKTKELEIANEALTKSGTTVQNLSAAVDKQTDTIVKQSDVIIKQAERNAKTEIDLESAKKSASRWRIAAAIATVATIAARVL